jgi:magnesium chelatase subunit I
MIAGKLRFQRGLLQSANKRLLYIDEINLLDDHIVNILLDVVSTGILDVQRENINRKWRLSFILVGTMNPEEGDLRPQLLDRFGLMATIEPERSPEARRAILDRVLLFDEQMWRKNHGQSSVELEAARGGCGPRRPAR